MKHSRSSTIDAGIYQAGSFPAGAGMDRAANIVSRIMLCGLAGLALVTLLDVALRTFSSLSVRGLFEINGLAMAIIIAGSLGLVFLRSRNVGMDVMAKMVGPNPVAVQLFSWFGSSVLLAAFAASLVMRAREAGEFGETTTVLGYPTAPFWWAVGVLMCAVAASVLALTVRNFVMAVRERHDRSDGFWRGALVVGAAIGLAAMLLVSVMHEGIGAGLQGVIAFVALYILIAVQLPIGISLGLVGGACIALTIGTEQAFLVIQNEAGRALTSTDLAAIPLFLLMGNFATWAGLSGDIFRAGSSLMVSRRGGLAMASVMGCGAFGAICGSSIATTATFGRVAFAEMEKRRYAHSLAAGCIAAGGTLGALIPPSVVLIIYCVVVEESIQVAFQAALLPGLLAVCMYVLAIAVSVRVKPELAPHVEQFDARLAKQAMIQAWRPVLLFFIVLGGVYGGVFTTQEAASVGAILALLFALTSKDFTWEKFKASLDDTAINTGAIYVIFIGANIFASFMSFSNMASLVLEVVNLNTTPHWLILLCLVVMYLLLGTVFDTLAAVLVTTPIVIPLIVGMHYDLIWWGIVTLSLVEIGMITPPLGMNVFVMKSVVGDRLALSTIFRGIVPFLFADLLRLTLLILFPAITLWLPGILAG